MKIAHLNVPMNQQMNQPTTFKPIKNVSKIISYLIHRSFLVHHKKPKLSNAYYELP
jgi:hypothetical protein